MPDGGYGLLEVECCRGGTRASLPLMVSAVHATPIWTGSRAEKPIVQERPLRAARGGTKHHAANQIAVRADQIEEYLRRGFLLRMRGEESGQVHLISPTEITRESDLGPDQLRFAILAG
jgi:hypothetical protein